MEAQMSREQGVRTYEAILAGAADASIDRRPCKGRANPLLVAAAARLARATISPNLISVAGVFFSAACALSLVLTPMVSSSDAAILLLAAAALLAARGLCNLLDGMVAIESGMRTPAGAVFNELPERISDVVVLVALGYAIEPAWGHEAGWAAATLALLTAYVRVLGGALGLRQDFCGPMAKPQRVTLLIGACVLAAAQMAIQGTETALEIALLVIAAGSLATLYRRARRLCMELEAR
jgi:phosphatidylglycerophosphate synthase